MAARLMLLSGDSCRKTRLNWTVACVQSDESANLSGTFREKSSGSDEHESVNVAAGRNSAFGLRETGFLVQF